jgi:hypothetical protein
MGETADSVRPAPVAAEVAAIDEKIAKLEALIASGAVERVDVGPRLAELEALRRKAGRAAAGQAGASAIDAQVEAALAAFREAAAGLRDALAGDDVGRARSALVRLIGDVPVGRDGVADLELKPAGVFEAAGILQSGSGGRI